MNLYEWAECEQAINAAAAAAELDQRFVEKDYWHRHGFERNQLLGVPEQRGDDPLLATIIAPARAEQRRA